MTEEIMEEGMKFCPICGHEGNDEMCPVCNQKMESLDAEVDRVADLEKQKDLTEDAGLDDEVSLEEVASKEEAESGDSDQM